MTKTNPIDHAQAYPFDIPEQSFVLDKDSCRHLPVGLHQTTARHAVIASGSNASPKQLRTKFAPHPHLLDQPIYVTRAVLHDFDAVYSAHFSSYGSIPATLAHAPGAQISIFITWLTDAQLEHMHQTEAVGVNYDYTRLHGIRLNLEDGTTLDNAHAYLSRRGCLNHRGTPVPVAELTTQGRRWPAMSQCEVLDYARSLIAPGDDSETFIKTGINSPALRQKRAETLAETALPHGWKTLVFLS